MSQIYIEYIFTINPVQPATEIIIAELGLVNFESFVETEAGVKAYIQKKDWYPTILEDIFILTSETFKITNTFKEIEQVNWNHEWEKNFSPIEINDTCVIRAPFHKSFGAKYELIIEPKMSFGTGHHETTHMMIEFILEGNFESKKVLDMGCGTAVLAILAEKRGATFIDAIDIDNWCYLNSIENVERNNCKNINVFEGDAALLTNKKYNTIIANINRNILLNDMAKYVNCLSKEGELYLSGFLKEDLQIITECCNKFDLTFVESKERNKWISAKYVY